MAEAVERHPGIATRDAPARRPPPRRPAGTSGFRLGRIAGIEIRLDWSLAIVFALIVINLGGGVFPARHPGWWTPGLGWLMAVVAAALFLASILVHELAHALVGRRRGVPVDGITLFLFGGVARLRGEPRSAGAEFLIAIVGPLTSFAIGIVCSLAGVALAPDPAHGGLAVAALGPAATVLLWLGSTNLMLGLFNLVPGFPLDGGRVLRALLWRVTGDLRRATRGASAAGRAVAMLLIFTGVLMAFGVRVPLLGTGFGSGLWLVLIGWFLDNAARGSYQQLVVSEALRNVPVARVMKAPAATVSPDLPLSALVDPFFMQSDQRCLPVAERGRLAGMVCMGDLSRVDRAAWATTPVRAVMLDASQLEAAAPDESLADTLSKLGARDVDQLPVVDRERGLLVGVLRRADVLRWLEIHGAAV